MGREEVDLYSLSNVGFYEDMTPRGGIAFIGKQLWSLIRRDGDYAKLLLTDDNYTPILMKHGKSVVEFGYFDRKFAQPFSFFDAVPKKSCWHELEGQMTIVVEPNDINDYVAKSRVTPADAAKNILRDKLEEHGMEVAVFKTDAGKLATFLVNSIADMVYVEKSSWNFKELMQELDSRGYPLLE